MGTPIIAAIDQGTTSTRCLVYDQQAAVLGHAQKEHRQIFPRAGWVEHNPLEILANAREVLESALRQAGRAVRDLAGIGITNQRETIVVWDARDGLPYHHAIVWQDTRTRDFCNTLARDGGADRFRARTGLPLATYFSGPKLRWLLDHVDGLRQASEAGHALAGTIDTWLIWNLTGGPRGGAHVTDVTNASRTQLMNLQTLDWDDELLDTLQIPRRLLPRIVPSSQPEGWGLVTLGRDQAPVCAALGDQQAALLGQLCTQPGTVKNTYGTGCFMLLHTGGQPVISQHGLLTTVAGQFGDAPVQYALEGSVAMAGSLVQWLRDNLGLIRESPEIEDLAASVDDSGGIYVVPAFGGLFAPHWRSDARGVIVGLTHYIHKGHIARAVLEATAYQVHDVLQAMQADAGIQIDELRVDGGMTVNNLLMQFQADLLGIPVVRPQNTETTVLGAAFAAGLATGVWSGLDELAATWEADRRWQPTLDPAARTTRLAGWQDALQRSFDLA